MSLPFAKLTAVERECLRLVHGGFDTKEIAKMRTMSPNRVNAIIKGARSKFGGRRRNVVARMLAEYESAQATLRDDHLMAGHLMGVVNTLAFQPDEPANTPSEAERIDGTVSSGEAQEPLAPSPTVLFSLRLPIGRSGSESNALTTPLTLLTIAAGTIFVLDAVVTGASVYSMLDHAFLGQ